MFNCQIYTSIHDVTRNLGTIYYPCIACGKNFVETLSSFLFGWAVSCLAWWCDTILGWYDHLNITKKSMIGIHDVNIMPLSKEMFSYHPDDVIYSWLRSQSFGQVIDHNSKKKKTKKGLWKDHQEKGWFHFRTNRWYCWLELSCLISHHLQAVQGFLVLSHETI